MAERALPGPSPDELLVQDLNRFQQLLNRHHTDRLLREFDIWRKDQHREMKQRAKQVPRHARQRWMNDMMAQDRRDPANATARKLFDFLKLDIEHALERLVELQQRYDEFRRTLAQAPTERERRRILLEYSADLGAGPQQLRGDRRAMNRWFTDEALTDRYLRQRGETQQRLTFDLSRLAQLANRILSSMTEDGEIVRAWRRLEVERLALSALEYEEGDTRVQTAALQCLAVALQGMPKHLPGNAITDKTMTIVRRLATEVGADVWLQCQAIEVLRITAPSLVPDVLRLRFHDPTPGDDLFVRGRAVGFIFAHLTANPELERLIPQIAEDPSPLVRQEFVQALWQAPEQIATRWLPHMAREDKAPQVRAAVLAESLEHGDRNDLDSILLRIMADVMQHEQDPFVLRTAIHVSAEWLWRFTSRGPPDNHDDNTIDKRSEADRYRRIVRHYQSTIVPALNRLQDTAEAIPVRRWSAQAAERIWCRLDDRAEKLRCVLVHRASGLRPGKSRFLWRRALRGLDGDLIGRVLAVMAQDDFGYELEPVLFGYRITRGPVFGFRLWRFLYEMLHPATDKRQAFRHTIGRISDAPIRAPSAILGELSETKVPGEPLFMASDGTWLPFLPLADDFVSTLNRSFFSSRAVRFYTSQGITEVSAPRGPLAKLIAAWRLTTRFASFARQRNWDEDGAESPQRYLKRMSELGFRVRFQSYGETQNQADAGDTSVWRFFPAVLGIVDPRIVDTVRRYASDYAVYFTAAFENTLMHLLLLAIAAWGLLLLRHFYSNVTLRRARRRLPLSIGGWGTRGKSGTERLKAALLSALGYGVVSKSSGCEAMFLECRAFGELLELPLFRPYDKATIWEHRNLLLMASKLRPSAFLWECMGLTPAYVDVLQRQWTRDELATITNTYPDHEDLQGPAGINVAQVISGFVPRQSKVLTTEQQMRPLVAESCRKAGSHLVGVDWLQSGLITDDVMQRFPYQEHPDNIALVLALAREIGCPRDFALKAMADDMIADLGVLKTYPTAHVNTRRLEFTNGMSANERFGCLGNWKRTGYDQHDPAANPDVWITTVVNNRADRVARSRVFARILVHDIQADRHFLIGNNLKGLLGFIWEAWDELQSGVSLWPQSQTGDGKTPQAVLERMARSFRQPTDPAQIRAILQTMLEAVLDGLPGRSDTDRAALLAMWEHPDKLVDALDNLGADQSLVRAFHSRHQGLLQALNEYLAMRAAVQQNSKSDRKRLDNDFHGLLRTWFERKLVVIDDYYATGDQIVHRIMEETPPGHLNRLMGLQNIKGTGLDFVYRWQAWDACHTACEMLISRDARTAHAGLQALACMPSFGPLCAQHVRKTIDAARRLPTTQSESFQAELDQISGALEDSSSTPQADSPKPQPKRRGLIRWFVSSLEEFMDVHDAVRRRKKADLIYKDLVNERIGRQRAVAELRALNKRQKGGWLSDTLRC